MAPIRRRLGIAGVVALASVALVAAPVAAFHEGAVADCGDAGTFTLRSQHNEGGFSSPPVNSMLQFEGGGTLSQLQAYQNGVLVWDPAATGMASNNLDEVTCSFTMSNGVDLVITGIYTPGR